MRSINVVLFSSGISEENGILEYVKEKLTDKGYSCVYWRDLFAGAHDMNNISLLPMLIKKIPSFDFAVLICEGHDRTYILRNGIEQETPTMRDNVLFEIGLCVMALGLPRVILLTDEEVRMPDDLTGNHNSLAVKRIIYHPDQRSTYGNAGQTLINYMESLHSAVHHIDAYIKDNMNTISPVVIGAAASTACGYVGNFVFRTLEKINMGCLLASEEKKRFFSPDKIHMHIILPEEYTSDTPDKAYSMIRQFQKGCVPDARMRKAEFRYALKDDELHIYDYPTTLVTSYNTARIILSLDADDESDTNAKDRFFAKEMDLFECSLKALLNRAYLTDTVEHYYKDLSPHERNHIIETVSEIIENRVTVERITY